MKKLLAFAPIAALLVFPLLAGAQVTQTTSFVQASDIQGVFRIANKVAQWFMTIVIAISIIFFVMAGFLYVTSGGKEENLKSAKNYLLYGIIGVGVALLAGAIQVVVVNLISTT